MKLADFKTELATLVAPYDNEANRTRYRNRDIPRADAVKDINKRYRWDIWYAVTRRNREFFDAVQEVNPSDSHIDTLLRSVVPTL